MILKIYALLGVCVVTWISVDSLGFGGGGLGGGGVLGGAGGLGGLFGNNNNNNNGNRLQDRFMNGLLRGKYAVCNGTGNQANTMGVCRSPLECRKTGGTPSGSCALVGSCCTLERTCGNFTRAKVSYFTSPPTAIGNVLPPAMCDMRVDIFSNNVCQIRLDFDQFTLNGPNRNGPDRSCDTDSFAVVGVPNLGFQTLCGTNTGQHIYIPVNATNGANSITLRMVIAQVRTDPAGNPFPVQNPNWRIRIRQLECGVSQNDFSNVQSTLTTLYQNHKNKKNNNVLNDQQLIAPPGCLQYYTDPQGTYRSFNFESPVEQRVMVANTNYAICFRRVEGFCGATHVIDTFATYPDAVTNAACTAPDNVMITGGQGVVPTNPYYCGNIPTGTVTSNTPGPHTVIVVTDQTDVQPVGSTDPPPITGFRINYNTMANAC